MTRMVYYCGVIIRDVIYVAPRNIELAAEILSL